MFSALDDKEREIVIGAMEEKKFKYFKKKKTKFIKLQ